MELFFCPVFSGPRKRQCPKQNRLSAFISSLPSSQVISVLQTRMKGATDYLSPISPHIKLVLSLTFYCSIMTGFSGHTGQSFKVFYRKL